MAKPIILIVMRLADMTRVHPAQDNSRVCARCGETVGIYPSGQEVLVLVPEAELVCNVCYEQEPPPPILVLAPGAAEEPFESIEKE